MSKTIRQKISQAIQTTFRSSPKPKQRKTISCCSVKKPADYEYLPAEPKQTSAKNDYIDLSECHSWSLSYSKDSGFFNDRPLESTRILPSDTASISTISNLSSIRSHSDYSDSGAHDSMPRTVECCHCRCHHYLNNEMLTDRRNNYGYGSQHEQRPSTINKVYPFIF